MHDLPTGPALLALARDVLLRDLMPLLPPEAHLEIRRVASSIAIAEREAISGEAPARQLLQQLADLYGGRDDGEAELLRRFANDLRAGGFEKSGSRERQARETLWRLTIVKLRSANPRFLNANGFS
jgi:Domain of unknown function (DUF6285)